MEFKRRTISDENEMSSLIDDDERLIEDAITTPYEKVLKILGNTKSFLTNILKLNDIFKDSVVKNEITNNVKDLEWVIQRIQTHTLYTYELVGDEEEIQPQRFPESAEVKSFLHFLKNYSDSKEIKRRNHISKTADAKRVKNEILDCDIKINIKHRTMTNKARDFLAKLESNNDMMEIELKNKNDYKEENNIELKNEKLNDKEKEDNNTLNENSKVLDSVNITNFNKKPIEHTSNTPDDCNSTFTTSKSNQSILGNQAKKSEEIENDIKSKTKGKKLDRSLFKKINLEDNLDINKNLKITPSVSSQLKFTVDVKSIMSRDFNIHELTQNVGRLNLLPIIGKSILSTLGLMDIINSEKLDNFLQKVTSGYMDSVLYHNSIHGADVAQTISTFFINSNLEEISLLNNHDVLSIIIAALGHDIGHPGTNNGFHVNTYSNIAMTYNDQSVLENYHCSIVLKIIREEDSNIFDRFPESTYKYLRKRIIALILATDMTQHAKVISILKAKVVEYKENVNRLKEDKDTEKIKFITQSNFLYDDQQRLMDFIMHAADISHNVKKFKISKYWTDLLMEEFWRQGDMEKNMGLPISFLCDRTTSDVPKSQIGFIRGIITPTFEVLIDLLPSLGYLQDEIEKNIDQWTKLIDEKTLQTPKLFNALTKTPRTSAFRSPSIAANSAFFRNNLVGILKDPNVLKNVNKNINPNVNIPLDKKK